MWDWDEMIKNTAIVYAIGPQNTFAVHRREVNEIAMTIDDGANESRDVVCDFVVSNSWFKCKIKQLLTLERNEMNHALLKYEEN
jgi:hypothetical protein